MPSFSFFFFGLEFIRLEFMHLDLGTTWREGIVPGKTLSNKPIRLQSVFPLSWGVGLYSGGKRDRISQLVRTCWSCLFLVLSQRKSAVFWHTSWEGQCPNKKALGTSEPLAEQNGFTGPKHNCFPCTRGWLFLDPLAKLEWTCSFTDSG